jgi:hypothetical protein
MVERIYTEKGRNNLSQFQVPLAFRPLIAQGFIVNLITKMLIVNCGGRAMEAGVVVPNF